MEFSAQQIAAFVNGTVDGDPETKVNSFAKIEEAHKGDLTFLANPKYTHFIYSTNAGIVIVKDDFTPKEPVTATLIRVSNPYETLSELMRLVDTQINAHPTGVEQPSFVADGVEIPEDAYIGAFSYVGKGAKLGKGVKIYPQAYVGHDAVVGDGTVLYPGVKVYHGCRIGKRCILHSGVVVGADGFGFAPDEQGHYNKIPQLGIVTIGDDVELGANTTVDRATMGTTAVGRGTKIDNLVQVAHNVVVGSDTVMAAQVGIAGSAHIGSNCMVGGQAGISGHIHIGDRSQIGPQSGIHKDVDPGTRLMGSPAIPAREYMRMAACLNRLPELFDQVREIKKP